MSLLKFIDQTVGVLAIAMFPSAPVRTSPEPRRILFIRPGGIGDVVLLAPAIIMLKRVYPQAHISILAEKRNSGVLPLIPEVAEVFCYDRPREFCKAVRGRYDIVVDTEQWYSLSAIVARLLGAPFSIGFDTNSRRRMFTHPVAYSQADHETYSFLNLLDPLGIEAGVALPSVPFLTISPAVSSKADAMLKLAPGVVFVTIFPGASIPERRWGADHFRRVAEVLANSGVQIVVVGGGEDRQQGKIIVSGGLGLNLAGKTTLPETAAVLARSRLVICGDSGVLHIAAGLGVPTVSLFGPSSEVKWAPRGDNHVVLNRHVPCSPCSRFGTIPPCPINVRCMKEITPEEVVEAARRLLLQPPEQKI